MSTGTEKLLYRPDEAAAMLSLSRRKLYDELRSGRLRSFSCGAARLVAHDDILAWIDARRAPEPEAEAS